MERASEDLSNLLRQAITLLISQVINHVDLFLSADHEAANATLIAEINNFTNVYEHDKYPEQTSITITLQADTYYYIELTHKESSGGRSFLQPSGKLLQITLGK